MARKAQSNSLADSVNDATLGANRFEFERAWLAKGVCGIAGVDEAGRGPLAGPVVAAAVIFSTRCIDSGLPTEWVGLNDSKQLTRPQREKFFAWLMSSAEIRHAIAIVDVDVIDDINILYATHRAMNAALAQLLPAPEHVLVDGLPVNSLRFPQTALVKGDSRSYSIAAASVLAKVTRDRLMEQYDRLYPDYGFARRKGYGTAHHLAALMNLGPCPIHRRSFAPLKIQPPKLF